MTADSASAELVVSAFLNELRRGNRPQIEVHVADWLEQERTELIQRLVTAEWDYLSSTGQAIDRDSYLDRFPELVGRPTEPDTEERGQQTTAASPRDPDATEIFAGKDSGEPAQTTGELGDYELIAEIARGGMGVVYRARQKQANRIVALKMILAGELAGEEEIARFYKEAEAAAKLDYPGIVPLYDVGELDGRPYLSMAFVDGDSLAHAIREQPLAPRRAAEVLLDVADALQYAHDRQIIHRDLKPGNILLDSHGSPRITDFGLAKQLEADSQLTQTGQILGTPSYMPPEQACGEMDSIDARADVYSLGAILYAVLTGRPPHQAATLPQTLRAVAEQAPVPPRQLVASIPRDLETICLKALAKAPARRYQSAAALRDDLRRHLQQEPIHARRVGVFEKSWLWCQRNPRACLAAAVVILMSIGGLMGAYEWRMRAAASVLVDNLAEADPDGVLAIADQLKAYGHRADERLSALAKSETEDADNQSHRLHAQMTLVAGDEALVEPLFEQLLDARLTYVESITKVLTPYREQIVRLAWPVFRNEDAPESRRFRAGLVLAQLADDSDRWEDSDAEFLNRLYMETNPEFHPIARRCLHGIRERLRPHILSVYRNPNAERSHLSSAAILVRDYFAADTDILLPLVLSSNAEQFLILYPLIRRTSGFDQNLLSRLKTLPTASTETHARVTLGIERAAAAITLLRKGYRREVLSVFQVNEDAEALSQFVARCRSREVVLKELLECWQLLPTPAARRSMPANERRQYDTQHYGLLLAMAEYPLRAARSFQGGEVVRQVVELFENDPASGVHAAAGWLLRKWGAEDAELLAEATRLEQRTVPFRDDREWFSVRISVPDGSSEARRVFYQTYVVFSAGEYEFGSPADELRQDDEVRHRRHVARFAILEREVTRDEYEVSGHHIEKIERFSGTLNHVSQGFNWYDSVRYCRWLNRHIGFGDQQPYPAPESLDEAEFPRDPRDDSGPAPKSWPIDLALHGMRLPTEHEWELMCRAGTRTAFSFGGDTQLLAQYGWYQDSSGKVAHEPRELRPNLRGIFDAHGNAYEWVHDWDGGYATAEDAAGPPNGDIRMTRGGSWFLTPAYCRSSFRYAYPPSNRNVDFGLRLARTLPARHVSE